MKLFVRIAIFGAIIVFFVASFDLREYQQHHTKDISVSWARAYFSQGTLHVSPWNEAWILQKIQSAKKQVWVAVYTFTLPNLRESLLEAKKRGVDVRIILEKFPYGNTSINRETEKFFQENVLSFHLSWPEQFAFMHAKYMLIDDEWIIETANWTRTSFSTNREFFISGRDTDIYSNLRDIFEDDFRGKKGTSKYASLIVWPTNARIQMEKYIEETSQKLDIYTPSFTDSELLIKITQLCHAWKIIRILLDKNDSEKPAYDTCLQVRYRHWSLHAKSLIRDNQDAFVGSFNFTKNSLENNREIGLFISWEVVKSMAEIFASDWKQWEVAKP